MEKLRNFREQLGKTQEQMANDFEISKSFYEKIESGTKKPGRELIEKVKKKYPFLDVNIFLE
ncbi:MAG: helix-turn-helix domain-containing protein [Erysipelotrichaceae bacterium]|nr:helix-turn-helix domain-containing protein [Erysipelotrichaceae bacterium]